MTADLSELEILQYLEGEVTASRAAEIRAHLDICARCRAERDRLGRMIDAIGVADPRLLDLDLTGEVRTVLSLGLGPQPNRARSRRSVMVAIAAIAAALGAVAAVAILPRSDDPERSELRAKSADLKDDETRWTGVQAFAASDSGAVEKLGSQLKAQSLMFTYSNKGPRPYDHLMIFGVDATGTVRWYYPAWTNVAEDPTAIPISRGDTAVPLPERVRHPLPKGRLLIYGLFLRRPLPVSGVEARIAELRRQGGFHPTAKPPDLKIGDETFEQVLVTEVE